MVKFDADAYQKMTAETELYTDASMQFLAEANEVFPHNHPITVLSMMYCAGKLNGEAGEVAEVVFKAFRGNGGHLSGEQKVALQKELGDCMWYIARLADLIGCPLSVIMEQNIDKLMDRKERGVVHGYGDNR